MDKTAIKNFAISARRKLIENVSQKAYGLGISDNEIKPIEELPDGSRIEINNNYVYLNHKEVENREKLIEQIESKGYEQVIEEVAYTWFNRIIAIRFMEVNDYLPSGVRVLSSEENGKVEPDAVTQSHDLIDELNLKSEIVYNFQDNNDSEGLFKYILIKQCNALGKIMPVMFEKIEDYTELLLPDNLLVEGSVVRDLVSNISEEDFKEQVEIIGWLYQYYISEKKEIVDKKVSSGKKVEKHDLPAKTQLFTPDWIVKYMVENSLGRLWLEGHPNEELQSGWKYYLEEARQEPEVEAELEKIRKESKNLSPEEITVLDPSMGSGHILVYAFDVLYEIYVSAGYSEREIPRLILEKNLYGLDIDDRAGQLAYFALIMKARSYSRRLFRDMERNPIELNICSIQESNGLTREDIDYFCSYDESLREDLEYIVDVYKDAKEYGSILDIKKLNYKKINKVVDEIKKESGDLFSRINRTRILDKINAIINQAIIMSNRYLVMCTNPPYMGRRAMNKKLCSYLENNYKDTKSDLFSVFVDLERLYLEKWGYLAMITSDSLMFISSYEQIRKKIIENNIIYNLLNLGSKGFNEVSISSVAFVTRKMKVKKYKGAYVKLSSFNNSEQKEKALLNRNNEFIEKNIYYTDQNNFENIPNTPMAYWCSKTLIDIFEKCKSIDELYTLKAGVSTGNNDLFLRFWHEVNVKKIGFNINSYDEYINKNPKWYLYNKGGGYQKWYGDTGNIINLQNEGSDIKRLVSKEIYRLRDPKDYFKKCIAWPNIGADKFSAKLINNNMVIDRTSNGIYFDAEFSYYILALLNSCVVNSIINLLNPTNSFTIDSVANIPIKYNQADSVNKISKECVNIWKNDNALYEQHRDFKIHPLLHYQDENIAKSLSIFEEFKEKQFSQLKSNEEEINKIFIEIYGLQDELTPEVEDKDITIRKADRDREMKSFISYAVGCMMGRYSLDEEGLVFAGGEFDINKYKTFKANKDAIIPITDDEYFEDDIVSKFVEFLKVVFGEDSLEDNLNYIADTECFKRKANETSRDCIRRYFLKGFMEDHLKVYQKRPIYWMFDSGKQNGFKALIYMHRYDENMVGNIRANYLHILQRKYESEINRLDNDMNSEVLSTKEKATAKKLKEKIQKQLVECTAYDQVIAHVAHQRISIDLDDGVKVNYQKFQGIEVPQGDGKKDLKADLLFKVKM